MATKIFYNDNRIIIDGHSDTIEECRAITAMCDEMANSENFKTIVYEKGHAVFEQVSGGEKMMFAMQDYVLTSRYDAETGYSAALLAAVGSIAERLEYLEDRVEFWDVDTQGSIPEQIHRLGQRIAALENKPTEVLPYTASQLAALLAKLENLE